MTDSSANSEPDSGVRRSGLLLAMPNCPLSRDELLSREPCRVYEIREYSTIGIGEDAPVVLAYGW